MAALEALLGVRELLPLQAHVDLIAPHPSFVYEPMSVLEPFGLARTQTLDLAAFAAELDAELHVGALERVDCERREAVLAGGARLPYDAAIVAVGARRVAWLGGALAFAGAGDAGAFACLLARLQSGAVSRLAFTAPPGTSWTLPLYELALLSASWLADRGVTDVALAVVSPESEPLALFGANASRMLRDQLADRGIRLHTGAAAVKVEHGALRLAGGGEVAAEEVVALPRLLGPRIAGLPADGEDFIPIDAHCRVVGVEDVYAAGDGTDFPIKQGGMAAQQADTAVEAIAARLGSSRPAGPLAPMLRGMLLTGVAPMYLRTPLSGERTVIAATPLWTPSTKVAGRYLGPRLASVDPLPADGEPQEAQPPIARDAP